MNGIHAERERRHRAVRPGARARLLLPLAGVLMGGLLPAGASASHSYVTVTCNPSTIGPGEATNCDATIQGGWYDGSNPTGTVTWTASQAGTFAPEACSPTVIGYEQTTCGTRFTSSSAASHDDRVPELAGQR